MYTDLSSDFALTLDGILILIKHLLALTGGIIIFLGALRALKEFCVYFFSRQLVTTTIGIDYIRLKFGRSIILGLEFIVASDVIETTTAPDYYSLGILGILVLIRTFLSYFLNREISELGDVNQKINQK